MPRKFIFGLQPVIDRRKQVEDVTRQLVARTQRERDEAKCELDRLEAAFRARASSLRDLQTLECSIGAQTRLLAEREAALEEARKELVAANQKRRVVEKLKERYLARLDAAEMRAEEAEIDESNLRR
jgi:flagellar export protein FliJ